MELDILLRGQSNAFLFASDDFGGIGINTLVDEVQRLLGFDGANDQIRLAADWYTPGQQTIHGGTAFLGDWVERDANGDWQALSHEQDLLNYIARNPHPQAAETAVVWLHSEYDSLNPGLTQAEWESAVRADAAWVRQELGRDAAHSPYVFVSAIPFASASDTATQAIRQGMEDLSADPSFGALVGARALDIDMGFKFWNETTTLDYGAAHMSEQDTVQTAQRLARSLAEEWAEYARPGSPVALAGGAIADGGPEVVGAKLQDLNTLLVEVAQDHSAGFAALDPDAAAGTGWSVWSAGGVATADRVEVLSADTLLVHFTTDLPADGLVHYGHGYGRLAQHDEPGRGNAIYDQDGMPLWVPARGVRIDASATPSPTPDPTPTAPTPPTPLTAGVGPDALVLKISQDAYQGPAQYTVKVDGMQVGGTFTASAWHSAGQSDTLTLKGDWAAGAHQVSVEFLNDAWGGTSETDRNLYVEGAAYNGQAVAGAAQAIESDWKPGAFSFTDAAMPAPTVGTDGPDLFEATPAGGVFTGGGGRDFYMLEAGDGPVTVTDFAPDTDKLMFVDFDREDVAVTKAAEGGASGLLVNYGDGGGVFLADATALADRDMIFA